MDVDLQELQVFSIPIVHAANAVRLNPASAPAIFTEYPRNTDSNLDERQKEQERLEEIKRFDDDTQYMGKASSRWKVQSRTRTTQSQPSQSAGAINAPETVPNDPNW